MSGPGPGPTTFTVVTLALDRSVSDVTSYPGTAQTASRSTPVRRASVLTP